MTFKIWQHKPARLGLSNWQDEHYPDYSSALCQKGTSNIKVANFIKIHTFVY